MIYTPLTCEAMKLAYRAHDGQVDKSGLPYIFHPFHLAEQMTDEYSVCVALLHDVVEDTSVTIEQLEAIFPREITEAVALMTHPEDIPYFDYIEKIRTNPLARTDKLADLQHNSDVTRIPNPSASILQRREMYAQAIALLIQEGDHIHV